MALKPRFIKADPPSNADISVVLQKISLRVIRKLRRLGYLESGIDVPVATGYDPLLDNEPELARSMAASVRQRIAFGERSGEKVRRIGHGFGYEGERPELKGMRCATVNGFSLHADTDVAAHRRDQLEREKYPCGFSASPQLGNAQSGQTHQDGLGLVHYIMIVHYIIIGENFSPASYNYSI